MGDDGSVNPVNPLNKCPHRKTARLKDKKIRLALVKYSLYVVSERVWGMIISLTPAAAASARTFTFRRL